MTGPVYDFIVIGAGSAGCAAAAGLAERSAGSVLVIEAGPSHRHPLVSMPFGLVWLMRSGRDWNYRSTPQAGLGGRSVGIPRGRMVGGSGSINSMVWFRGRASDFDDWRVPGWSWADVAPAFDEIEARIGPSRLEGAHPLTEALGTIAGNDPTALPSPETEGFGVFRHNLRRGRRVSAANAFLDPHLGRGVALLQRAEVARIGLGRDGRADRVQFRDGTELRARQGIVMSAGAIGTPEILLRSGIGPAEDLRAAGIDPVLDIPALGTNLHDHPGVGLHFAGPGTGYGLTPGQALTWAVAPIRWLVSGRGVLASPTVEGGGFFNARGDGGAPDVQSHFIPFMMGWEGKTIVSGAGYFADVCLCRPTSRGRLAMGRSGLDIDLGLFSDPSDLETLVHGVRRLRDLLALADFGPRRGEERFPGVAVSSDDAIAGFIRSRAGTAYHPVGTCRMGSDADAVITPRLAVRGVDGLWVADASAMPALTSANTNAPAMMIGHRAGRMISEDAA